MNSARMNRLRVAMGNSDLNWKATPWERDKYRCPKGHVIDGKRGDGKRYCKTCERERAQRRRDGQ